MAGRIFAALSIFATIAAVAGCKRASGVDIEGDAEIVEDGHGKIVDQNSGQLPVASCQPHEAERNFAGILTVTAIQFRSPESYEGGTCDWQLATGLSHFPQLTRIARWGIMGASIALLPSLRG